jgi:hypothetical protein
MEYGSQKEQYPKTKKRPKNKNYSNSQKCPKN